VSTVWFVSRHRGAVEWVARRGIEVDEEVDHLDVDRVQGGDTVIGTLPVHLAAKVCKKGARYLHLSIDIPPELRGREMSVEDMQRCGARLEEFYVKKVDGNQ
jgi:CRISPR-associated protein Csx16